MRNLSALQIGPQHYSRDQHSTLFKHMNLANDGYGRDHYHIREGVKEDMPFMCLLKADLESEHQYAKGVIGGRDDDQIRKTEMLFVEFETWKNEFGQIYIGVNARDRRTTYEESIKLANYCLVAMALSSHELTNPSSGGNGANKKGFYPQSAQNTGIFSTFDETFDRAIKESVLPEQMRYFFGESNYNLIGYNNDPKKILSPKLKEILL